MDKVFTEIGKSYIIRSWFSYFGGGCDNLSHFICTFGQVLSEWMEKNCYNATSLTKKMNEKSRTVIARLMKDESGYKSCSAFWKRFRKAFPELSQTDSKRFEEGLEVEKLGLEQYQIRSLFQSQLMGPEQPERPSELGKKLNAWIGEQPCEILALGCFDTEILQAFQLLLKRSSGSVSVDQHVLEDCTPYLYFSFWDGVRLQFNPHYHLSVYKKGCLKEQAGVCAQNALFLHRADDAWKILRKQKSGWQEVEWEGGPNPIRLYTRALNEAETLREKFMNHYDSDDLLGFMFSCMEKEHNQVLYYLKEDIGIEYLPVELLRDAIGDHPEQIGLDWEKNGAAIRALCYARFQNLYHKNQPTYLTVTRKGMERFAKTGRLSDHVACFRSFTPEERKWILEFICCQAETVPSFSIRFLKNDRALPMTLVGIEEEGLIICPTNASYRLSEPYREVFVTDKKILEYYNRFYDSVLWKEWTESQEETLKGLRQMKELIET